MGFWIILCNFLSITKNSYSSRPLTRHHSYIWFGKFPVTLFLVYSVPIFTLWINDLCLTHFDRLLNRCTDLLQIWCWCFFGGPLPDLFKIKLLALFLMELLVILCIFSNSWIFFSETTDRNHSYIMVNQVFLTSIFLQISVWRPQCHLALLLCKRILTNASYSTPTPIN